ncbi:DUF1002 domain-containing protein [Brevibacillus dissolubilis]|uniref:DUF1002 domain-containing protein n=1 Tax=Brevibacillus dissolubilis TaxID=1844116 RepID=UPI00111623BD|nr:DUF1002 domain-containing protein [Brevibacillus dissolubilis]
MDISKLLNIAKGIPLDKLKTDEGLKEVIRELSKKGGKNLSDAELNNYVSQFKKLAKTENAGSLMEQLTKKGVSQSDLNNLKKRFKK